ncbi:DNA/RNA helicase [Fructilactobacillus florum]|uniref:DNA/RNA helicase n=1 Tax=Fructilactobacillus florum TaxID=640331 RepID=UPI00028EB5C4|nr:DNA/RNA helicase [Fructilactobacillus florum]EKK20541.1 ComF operon protein A, DNA transporter ATPase [Fructilactobacillus florum 2F]
MEQELAYGRLVPWRGTVPADWVNVQLQPALQVSQQSVYCNRCQQASDTKLTQLPNGAYYCYQCIQLGRLDSHMQLLTIPEPNHFTSSRQPLSWSGQLTKIQTRVAAEVLTAVQQGQSHLLWAVTGAGKTEITFPTIAWAMTQGWRIAIASPRVDVCIELFPRYQAAFRSIEMVLLHGTSPLKYRYCQLTICTTHQLMRFVAAFDLLILDEVDAFPFANNTMLELAAQRSLKATGVQLWLTATPNRKLQRQKSISYLPRRFHGKPLPQLHLEFCWGWNRCLSRHKIPARLLRLIRKKVAAGQRFLLFVPRINDLSVVDRVLRMRLKTTAKWATVYANDEERVFKVEKMRKQQVLFLITTTILERGVTFPGIDVIILGADDRVFTAATLVQIAGRVGRSSSRPTGMVHCLLGHYSTALCEATAQIAFLNRKGAHCE